MSFFTGMFAKPPDYAGQALGTEKKRQKAITQGTQAINTAFGGFNPQFYQQRQQAYVDYAMPQVAQQYRQTAAPIGFNLASRGLVGSSVGQKQWSDLAQASTGAKQQVYDTALGQSQDLQRAIEQQKNVLLANLYQSADPASAQQNAIATASGFAYPSTFTPVANMFSGLANAYAMQQAMNAYRPQTAIQTTSPYYGGTYGAGLPSGYSSINV